MPKPKDQFPVPSDWLDHRISIALLGAGGTGSEMLDALARLHGAITALGHPGGFKVHVFDPAAVSETNVLRQRFWHQDVGQNKALVQVQRLNVMLGLDWEAYPLEPDPTDLAEVDLVISCVDKASVRTKLAEMFYQATLEHYGELEDEPGHWPLWLDTGNDADTAQVVLGDLNEEITAYRTINGHRLPHVLDLYPEVASMEDNDAPSCSAAESLSSQQWGINRLTADVAANLLWQLLRHGAIDHHGAHIALSPITVSAMPIDPMYWQAMGYEPDTVSADQAA